MNTFLWRICPYIKEGFTALHLGFGCFEMRQMRESDPRGLYSTRVLEATWPHLYPEIPLPEPFTDTSPHRSRRVCISEHSVTVSVWSRMGQNYSVDAQLFMSASVFVCECECVCLWCRAAVFMFAWVFSRARRSVYVCVCKSTLESAFAYLFV